MYFICDVYDSSEYGMVKDYKELKELLINEVIDDLKNNRQDYDIVVGCTGILESLAKGKDSVKYVLDNLEGYGWKIIDLLEIQRDLEDIKNYFKGKLEYYGKIDEVINIINKGVNENGRKD